MARKDPRKSAKKWQSNTKAATTAMAEGVDRVETSPGVLAAKKLDKMRQNFNDAIDSGKTGERLEAVDLTEWKTAMKTKGVQRVAGGVDASLPKVEDFHVQLDSHQQTIDSKLERMPDVTLEDGINRATAQIRGMAEFRFKR